MTMNPLVNLLKWTAIDHILVGRLMICCVMSCWWDGAYQLNPEPCKWQLKNKGKVDILSTLILRRGTDSRIGYIFGYYATALQLNIKTYWMVSLRGKRD